MEWYYAKDGESIGPVSFEDLRRLVREHRLGSGDLVWNASMGSEWSKVSALDGLLDTPETTLPPLSPTRTDRPRTAAVSLVIPARDAWAGMKIILFAPFDLSKWFMLGFSAWLATLGEGGTPSFNWGGGKSGGGSGGGEEFNRVWGMVRDFWSENAALLISLAVVLVLTALAFGVVVSWVRSRGKFMFLDNVIHNRGEIKPPWHAFRREGNSLFWWTVCYGLVCLVILLVLLALAWPLVIRPCIQAGNLTGGAIGSGTVLLVLVAALAIVGGYIARFLEDFVVPIMYRNRIGAVAAWGMFGELFGRNVGRFLVYGLFYLLLQLCAGMLVMVVVVVTCCIAGCLMAIPYLGAVLLLPVTVYFRLFSLEYLSQHGPAFNVGDERAA